MVCRTVFLLGMATSMACFGSAVAQQLGLQDLINISRSSRDRMKSVDVTYEFRQECVGGTPAEGTEAVSYLRWRVIFDVQSERYVTFRQHREDERLVELQEAYAQGSLTSYDRESGGASISNAPGRYASLKMEVPILALSLMYTPQPNGLGVDDLSLESFLKHGVIRPAQEAVADADCLVVDAVVSRNGSDVRYATIWLDPTRDFLPRRIVTYGRDEDLQEIPLTDQTTFEAQQVPMLDGGTVWLPTKVEVLSRVAEGTYKQSYQVDVEQLAVNKPYSEADFRLNFPPGTRVVDAVSNSTFVVPGESQAKLDLGRPQAEQRSRPSHFPSPWWLLVLVPILLVVIWRSSKKT